MKVSSLDFLSVSAAVLSLLPATLGFAPLHHHHQHERNARMQTITTTTTSSARQRQQHVRLFETKEKQEVTTTTSTTTQAEAADALSNVGWSMPTEGDLTSDDPFVQAIDAGIQRDVGVSLEELLNPAKVVNLERDLYNLRLQLAQLTGADIDDDDDDTNVSGLTTAECDAGGGGDEAETIRASIAKKETDLTIERRSVFRGWLKTVFLVQAILSFALSWVLATNPGQLFGGFDWYYTNNMDVSLQVLGYWWWWLFVIPSLRSRRPKGLEKKALDIAFVASPAISLVAPLATKDTGLIWAANLVVVAASYAFAYASPDDDDDDDDDSSKPQPEWLKFIYKSLDFGSGRERGARN